MQNILIFLCLLPLVLIFGGCTSPIEDYVNEKLPPVSIEENRKKATENFSKNLSALKIPTLAFQIDTKRASKLILTQELEEMGVTKLNITSDRQIVEANISFDVQLDDHFDNADVKSWKPEIKGDIKVYLGVKLELDNKQSEIGISFLPGLSYINISSIKINNDFDVTLFGDLLVNLINKYADNISGELGRMDIMHINLPSEYTGKFRISDKLQNNKFGDGVSVTVSDEEISLDYALSNTTFAFHKDKIGGMIEFYNDALYEKESQLIEPLKYSIDFADIYSEYSHLQTEAFDGQLPDSLVWLGVRKSLISTFISQTINQGKLCTKIDANRTENFSDKIELPDGGGISCGSTRDCRQTRDCKVNTSRDTRNCRRCLVGNPFGGCAVRGNDPFCEAAKAAQNLIYKADAAGRKLDCERIKEQKRLACEVEKGVEITACKAGKEIITAIGRTGNFANIKAKIDVEGNANLCLTNATFSTNMLQLNAGLRVSGSVRTDIDFSFTPLDIVGHMVCPFPWNEIYHVSANMSEQSLEIQTDVKLDFEGGKGKYQYTVKPITVEVILNPAPLDLLIDVLGSDKMTMSCPITAIGRAITIPLRGNLPPLKNHQTVSSPEVIGKGEFDVPTIDLMGKPEPFVIEFRNESLVVSLKGN